MRMTLSAFLGLFQMGLIAQNLVPNSSFENSVSCPNGSGLINLASPWVSPTAITPDYFNECSSSNRCSVPNSIYGHRWPRTGKAFAGLGIYASNIRNDREYIEVMLDDSLIRGHEYCIGFYVSLSEEAMYATNGLSAYFSSALVTCPPCSLMPYMPQVNYLGNPITDTLEWILISGTFIANGGEHFVTIGNFNDDTNISIKLVNATVVTNPAAYYYIDDVYVGTCDTTPVPDSSSGLLIPNIFTPNGDGKNDLFKMSGANIHSFSCTIYDRWGVQIAQLNSPDDAWDGRNKNGEPCSDGVYFYVATAVGNDRKKYTCNGFLELVR